MYLYSPGSQAVVDKEELRPAEQANKTKRTPPHIDMIIPSPPVATTVTFPTLSYK